MIGIAQTANLSSAKSQKEKKELRKILQGNPLEAFPEARPTPARRAVEREEAEAHRLMFVKKFMRERGYDVDRDVQNEDSKNSVYHGKGSDGQRKEAG